jgi:hypothetical protein
MTLGRRRKPACLSYTTLLPTPTPCCGRKMPTT